MGIEDWNPICNHVEKIEEELVEREGIADYYLEQFIISLASSSSFDEHSTARDPDSSSGSLSGVQEL
jgi:hypothetical protein